MAVPAPTTPGLRIQSTIHQVDEQRNWRLQARRHEGRVSPVGPTQKQTRDELRNYGKSAQVGPPTLLIRVFFVKEISRYAKFPMTFLAIYPKNLQFSTRNFPFSSRIFLPFLSNSPQNNLSLANFSNFRTDFIHS